MNAFYDLAHGPVSYDFITWLVRARLVAGARALHVVLVPHESGLGGFSRHWGPHDEAAARWRLWHIVVAACPLAGATVTVAASRAQAAALRRDGDWWPEGKAHLARDLVALAKGGAQIPRLAATPAAVRYVARWLEGSGTVVTFTLRRQENDPARNSNAGAAGEAAEALRRRGITPVVLADTNDALGIGRGYAELDIDLRLALYERATMNVVGNNGPAALLWHSRAPYLRMGAGQPADWTANLGLAQGEQVPWALERQRCVYAPDTAADILEALRAWVGATN